MRKKGGFLSGLQMKIGGWIEGAWSMALLVLLFSPCAMGMIIVIALAPGINRNSDKILQEGEVYLHWLFLLISEYATVLFIFLFFLAILAYLAISNLSRAAGHAATVIAKVYLPSPQLPAPQVTYNVGAPSQEIQATPVLSAPMGERPALPAPAATPAAKIAKTIKGLGLAAVVTELAKGPQVITYGLTPEEKKNGRLTTVQELKGKSDDIALALKAQSIRFYLHEGYLALEVPRKKREYVSLFELFSTQEWRNGEASVPLALGKDTFGNWIVGDLAKLPHLLTGGTTGGGKSVALNGILCGLLHHFGSEQLILKLIDPKRGVEFSTFADFGELITEAEEFKPLLKSLIKEMEERYNLLSAAKKKNIQSYNKVASVPMAYIIVAIDEYGDIVLSEDVEQEMIKLAQKSRATGIHFILATQRPDKDIVTGPIKANFPGRLALKTADKINAGIILDAGGAEALAGWGDALYKGDDSSIRRVQVGYASDREIEAFLGSESVRNRWGLVPNQARTKPEPRQNQARTSSEPTRTSSEPTRTVREPAELANRLRLAGDSEEEIARQLAIQCRHWARTPLLEFVTMERKKFLRLTKEARMGVSNGHDKEKNHA